MICVYSLECSRVLRYGSHEMIVKLGRGGGDGRLEKVRNTGGVWQVVGLKGHPANFKCPTGKIRHSAGKIILQ